MSGSYHDVEAGDCVESVADAHGFFWQTLWNLPENRELRSKRKNPNVLLPGDRLYVPEKRLRIEDKPTDRRHRFLRRGVPSYVDLRLQRNGEPRAGIPFTIVVDGTSISGQADAAGRIRVPVPPGARVAELRVGPGSMPETYSINLGHLDPVTEIGGLQQRLANLGFDCPVTGSLDESTSRSLGEFQRRFGLAVSGQPDGPTRDKIRELHGS